MLPTSSHSASVVLFHSASLFHQPTDFHPFVSFSPLARGVRSIHIHISGLPSPLPRSRARTHASGTIPPLHGRPTFKSSRPAHVLTHASSHPELTSHLNLLTCRIVPCPFRLSTLSIHVTSTSASKSAVLISVSSSLSRVVFIFEGRFSSHISAALHASSPFPDPTLLQHLLCALPLVHQYLHRTRRRITPIPSLSPRSRHLSTSPHLSSSLSSERDPAS